MLNVFHRDTAFFDLFDGMADHVSSCARRLQHLANNFPDATSEARRIHEEEHEADQLTHLMVDRLDRTFLPPIDREDVHALAGGLDDIIDMIDDVVHLLDLYRVQWIEPGFVRQTEVLVSAATTVNDAVHRLRKTRRLSDLGPMLVEIHRLESVGDDNHHAAPAKLFDGTSEALFVLKWKGLHALIEQAIDACEDVGNILERIVLKGQ